MDLSFELIELKIKLNEIKFKYDSLLEKNTKKNKLKTTKNNKNFHPVRLDDPTKKYNYDDMDLSEH